jgi:hypothetical protein
MRRMWLSNIASLCKEPSPVLEPGHHYFQGLSSIFSSNRTSPAMSPTSALKGECLRGSLLRCHSPKRAVGKHGVDLPRYLMPILILRDRRLFILFLGPSKVRRPTLLDVLSVSTRKDHICRLVGSTDSFGFIHGPIRLVHQFDNRACSLGVEPNRSDTERE